MGSTARLRLVWAVASWLLQSSAPSPACDLRAPGPTSRDTGRAEPMVGRQWFFPRFNGLRRGLVARSGTLRGLRGRWLSKIEVKFEFQINE